MLVIRTQVFMLAEQALCLLSHLPQPPELDLNPGFATYINDLNAFVPLFAALKK